MAKVSYWRRSFIFLGHRFCAVGLSSLTQTGRLRWSTVVFRNSVYREIDKLIWSKREYRYRPDPNDVIENFKKKYLDRL